MRHNILTWKPWKGENQKVCFCYNILFTIVSTNWLWVHPHSSSPTPTGSEGNNLLFNMSAPTNREAPTSLASTNLPKLHPSSLLCLMEFDLWKLWLCSSLSSILGHGQRHSSTGSYFLFNLHFECLLCVEDRWLKNTYLLSFYIVYSTCLSIKTCPFKKTMCLFITMHFHNFPFYYFLALF